MPLYKIVDCPGKGRALIATSDIPAGKAVLIDQPYAATLFTEHADTRSFFSFSESESLLRCTGCKFARYRSKAEQQADWKSGHKEECKALQSRAPDYPGPAARLVSRILWRRIREMKNPEEKGLGGTFENVLALMDHWEDYSPMHQARFSEMSFVIRMFMDPKCKLMDYLPSRLIATMFARTACYGFTVTDGELRPLGIGLYTTAGLANHDCRPNCMQTYMGTAMCIRAQRDIKAGEEITVAYVPATESKLQRRQQILDRYFFDICSAQERENFTKMMPVRRYTSSHGLKIEMNIWQTSPWEFDEVDRKLVEVVLKPQNGKVELLPRSGIAADNSIHRWEAHYLRDQQEYGFGDSTEDYKDPNWRAQFLTSSPAAEAEAFTRAAGPRQSSDFIVNLWGPAFIHDGQIQWEHAARLSGYAAACQVLVRENQLFMEDQPTMSRAEFWLRSAELEKQDKALCRFDYPITLGDFNVIRADCLEAKFNIARQSERYEAAFKLGKELRAFKVFMLPVAPGELMLLDACMARFGMLLERHREAQPFARSALRQMKFISPDTPEVYQMQSVLEIVSTRMRKSNLA